jgi:putative holliday junction resolvase
MPFEKEDSRPLDVRAGKGPRGRVLALDWGAKRIGVAISDELRLTARCLQPLRRTRWKQLLGQLAALLREFDVHLVVFGLPLRLDGTEGDAAAEVRRVGAHLSLSLGVPHSLQDERLTSFEAEANLRAAGHDEREVSRRRDSEAARLILLDYLSRPEPQEVDADEPLSDDAHTSAHDRP